MPEIDAHGRDLLHESRFERGEDVAPRGRCTERQREVAAVEQVLGEPAARQTERADGPGRVVVDGRLSRSRGCCGNIGSSAARLP